MTDGKGPRPIRTFGRRGGRPVSARQQKLLDELYPQLAVRLGEPGTLDPQSLFDDPAEIWLEIGFGGGEHLAEQARRNQQVGLIGCEPFIEGMAKALGLIEDYGLTNIRLHNDDARDVMAALKPASIKRIFILFPDPWPKKKQQKRRLIQADFLTELARIAAPGAHVRFATDVRSYADEALATFLEHGAFSWRAENADDWRKAPSDHIPTRYEVKRLGDCAPVWFEFELCPAD